MKRVVVVVEAGAVASVVVVVDLVRPKRGRIMRVWSFDQDLTNVS